MSELQSVLARRLSRLNEVGESIKSQVERDESPDTVIDQANVVNNNNISIAEKIEEGVGDSKDDHTSKPLSVGDNDYQDAIGLALLQDMMLWRTL